jgi:hypothetical protein
MAPPGLPQQRHRRAGDRREQLFVGVRIGAQADGDVVGQAGATITTDVGQPDNPGFIYLFGGNVTNSGTLISPAGEVALVSGICP